MGILSLSQINFLYNHFLDCIMGKARDLLVRITVSVGLLIAVILSIMTDAVFDIVSGDTSDLNAVLFASRLLIGPLIMLTVTRKYINSLSKERDKDNERLHNENKILQRDFEEKCLELRFAREEKQNILNQHGIQMDSYRNKWKLKQSQIDHNHAITIAQMNMALQTKQNELDNVLLRIKALEKLK